MTAAERMRAAEVLCRGDLFVARRSGRYLLVELTAPHRVVSTSVQCGGGARRPVVPGQPPELRGDRRRSPLRSDRRARARRVPRAGLRRDGRRDRPDGGHGHRRQHGLCRPPRGDLRRPPRRRARDRRRRRQRRPRGRSGGLDRGARTAAGSASGPLARTMRTTRRAPPAGTINTILLLNRPVTPAAQARAVVTMTGSQVGGAGRAGRAQPLLPHHCHRDRHGPVLRGGPARPAPRAEGRPPARTPSSAS